MVYGNIEIRGTLREQFSDVYTSQALEALSAMAAYNQRIKDVMALRIRRREARQGQQRRIGFLNAEDLIPGTNILVQDARDGKFEGSFIPPDLQRQWIQGTGPAAKPNAPLAHSIRNVAYALLSGADGWMFDGEDALGQTGSLSLENQRNLKLAMQKSPVFLEVAEQVSKEMNQWSMGFFGRELVADWRKQLDVTTKIFRARGLHLDDRHVRERGGRPLAAAIVDLTLYIVNNYQALQAAGSSIVLYLPKIQAAEEAAVWNELLVGLERHLELSIGTIKVYLLVEQLEATFQLMEIRAVLGKHFVGYNTGRWDYINSVADAMAWDVRFVHPDIEAITMTYGYMCHYEDRVRRAVNTPDTNGNFALWQGGMEPNIPVGSGKGIRESMERAVAGARREESAGASGKWVAHWKMVHIVRPVWEQAGKPNQLGMTFAPLRYSADDAESLTALASAPTTVAGARNLLSVALQYANAFGQGLQAAALKPADHFGDDDVLYLMEDMATGEIRLGILWEWLHKGAVFTADALDVAVKKGDVFSLALYERLEQEEYDKLLKASDKDVYHQSKGTTLPIAREMVNRYVTSSVKVPWGIDLLNVNLGVIDRPTASARIDRYLDSLKADGTRITENLDF